MPGCGRERLLPLMTSFHQDVASLKPHLMAICTDMCRACVHESLVVEILGDLFLSHTYIPCVQSDGGGVYVSVLFRKGKKSTVEL